MLVPQLRPGARLRCPKCGTGLKLPPGAVPTGKDAAGFLPAQEQSHPLGSEPTASLKPAENLDAEIDDLILADVHPPTPPAEQPKNQEPKDDGPKYHIPPTEVPPPPTMHVGSPQPPHHADQTSGAATTSSGSDADDDGEYKLADDLGPLPIPPEKLGAAAELIANRTPVAPPLPTPAVPSVGTSGPGEFDLGFDPGLSPSKVPHWRVGRMFAGFRARAATALRGGDKQSATAKPSKYTPHATLDDPRRAFLRGVFEFPFYLEVLPHWIKLWFWAFIELAFVKWILTLIGTDGVPMIATVWLIALATLIGAALVAMTWGVGSSILEDTAAGMSHVENWPEGFVLDDLPALIYPASAFFYAALPSAGIQWLATNGVPQIALLEPIVGLVLFPFALLSIMETGSVIQPISRPVFSCLRDRPGTWIWFYVESTLLLGLAVWGSAMLWLIGGFWRHTLAAGLITGAIIIYFRLLGRLALVCANQAARGIMHDEAAEREEQEAVESSADLPAGDSGNRRR